MLKEMPDLLLILGKAPGIFGGEGEGPDPNAKPQAGAAGESGKSTEDGEAEGEEEEGGDTKLSLSEARKLRRENQQLRREKKAAEEAKAALDAEKLTEKEKAEQRATAAEAKNKDLAAELAKERLSAKVSVEAAKLLFHDPADAILHLDLDDISISDDGKVDEPSVVKALKALAKDKPYLIKTSTQGSGDGGAGGGLQSAAKTTAEERIKARQKVLAGQGFIPIG